MVAAAVVVVVGDNGDDVLWWCLWCSGPLHAASSDC